MGEVGFKVGQTIQLSEGDDMEEATVIGLSDGIVLAKPLMRSHELGGRIYLVKDSTIDDNDSEYKGENGKLRDENILNEAPKTPYKEEKSKLYSIKSPFAIFGSINKNHVKGNGHLAWIKGTALHNLIHHGIKPATGAATGVADNDASINTTPHDLKDDELNYKPCPKCKGGKQPTTTKQAEEEKKEEKEEKEQIKKEEKKEEKEDEPAATGAEEEEKEEEPAATGAEEEEKEGKKPLSAHANAINKRIQAIKSRLRGKKQEEKEETDKEEEEEAEPKTRKPKTRKPFFGAKKETAEEKRARRSAGLKAAREAKAGKGSKKQEEKEETDKEEEEEEEEAKTEPKTRKPFI